MEIPFSIEAFFKVFETYNLAIQPAQILAYLLGVIAIIYAISDGAQSGKIVFTILAIFWGWVGAIYHIVYFSEINPAAYIFGAFFILQAIVLLYVGFRSENRSFQFEADGASIVGAIFIVYAMLVYPILNYIFGHTYPTMPVFGVTPCPVTIFTFGVLLWSKTRLPHYVIAIPFLWSLVGVSAALNFKIVEDYGLVVAGVVGALLLMTKKYVKLQRA